MQPALGETMGKRENWRALRRFSKAAAADPRVKAAFVGGSLANGSDDAHSDLDLYLIITADRYAEFLENVADFLATWGGVVFLDVTRNFFDLGFEMVHFVMADGVSGELALARPDNHKRIHAGPFDVLHDPDGFLEGVTYPREDADASSQERAVAHALHWFWLYLIDFSKAEARGDAWRCQAQLSRLRGALRKMLALSGLDAGDRAKAIIQMEASFVPCEADALRAACDTLTRVYERVAPAAARQHGLEMPRTLMRVALSKRRR